MQHRLDPNRRHVPGGFIFTNGEIVSSKRCEVNAEGVSCRHENSSAFFDTVEYNV